MTHSQLQQRLADALSAHGGEYRPRTRHLHENGSPIYTNRLILEDSPYLLQHAHNPVDWFPWGGEAFAEARKQDKPIFLSIGYATCHWCHVMEEQSFESETVAGLLNERFVSIKVDREQHPDVDATYMTAVTLFTGHGGWPMSSFLLPDGRPFFGGTYYPQASFIDLLTQVGRAWREQRDVLIRQAEQLADAVERNTSARLQVGEIQQNQLPAVIDSLLAQYDARLGGFSAAPKFPHEPLLLLISRILQENPDNALAAPFEHTLSAMAQGGIYDQVGGGFHRYAVDARWLIPHFEKMLYNQAYLSRVYLQAFLLNGNPLHERVVRQTLDYVLREMRDERGLFFSATDADSEGHEGTFFLWSIDEIRSLLSKADAQFVIDVFGMTPQGNFEGKNILYLPTSLPSFAQTQGLTIKEICRRLDPLLETLRNQRLTRIPPLTDNKVIVAWNGMMMTALAEAGRRLHEPAYLEAAEQAANVLWQTQRNETKMCRVNLNGKASVPARQEDYAHFSEALLALYDANGDQEYLKRARLLADEMMDLFLDPTSGALYMGNEGLLFTQPMDSYDGALPSGNAVAVRVLTRLAGRCGNQIYLDHARRILQAHADPLKRQPIAYAYMLAQLEELNNGEIGDLIYVANGSMRIGGNLQTTESGGYRLQLEFDVHETAWLLNEEPEATVMNPETWTLSENHPLQVRSKGFTKTLNVKFCGDPSNRKALRLKLTIQPCNGTSCLPKESIRLQLYPFK